MFSQIWSGYISRFLFQNTIVQTRTGIPIIDNTVIQDDLHSPTYPHSILYSAIPVAKGAEDANEVTLQVCKTSRILAFLYCGNRWSSVGQRGRHNLSEHNTGKEEIEEPKQFWRDG